MSKKGIKSFLTYYFGFMIEGSGSGFIPRTNGSRYRKPKQIRSATLKMSKVSVNCEESMI